jgi:hypothetical protein
LNLVKRIRVYIVIRIKKYWSLKMPANRVQTLILSLFTLASAVNAAMAQAMMRGSLSRNVTEDLARAAKNATIAAANSTEAAVEPVAESLTFSDPNGSVASARNRKPKGPKKPTRTQAPTVPPNAAVIPNDAIATFDIPKGDEVVTVYTGNKPSVRSLAKELRISREGITVVYDAQSPYPKKEQLLKFDTDVKDKIVLMTYANSIDVMIPDPRRGGYVGLFSIPRDATLDFFAKTARPAHIVGASSLEVESALGRGRRLGLNDEERKAVTVQPGVVPRRSYKR